MLAEKHQADRSKASGRTKRSAFNAAEAFKPMSVDELWQVRQTLDRILSGKIAAETAELKKHLAKLKA